MRELLAETGYPGMKVLQFAFDSDADNEFLPHNYTTSHCVVYTGTHDNDTLLHWAETLNREPLRFARAYLDVKAGRMCRRQWCVRHGPALRSWQLPRCRIFSRQAAKAE